MGEPGLVSPRGYDCIPSSVVAERRAKAARELRASPLTRFTAEPARAAMH